MAKAPEIIISLEKGEIAKLSLKDGDVLMVKIPFKLMKYGEEIAQRIKPAFPGRRILILPDTFQVSVVGAEEGEQAEEDSYSATA